MIDILTEFEKTDMLFDKTTQSLTSFPFNFDDIKIGGNEYVTDTAINDAIKKLHYNYLYIYRGCNVVNFEVFDSYYYTISSIRAEPLFVNVNNRYSLSKPENTVLTSGRSCVILPYDRVVQSSYVFVAEQNFITCLKTGLNVLDVVFKTSNADPLSGDIKFRNLTDIKSDLYDNLYVVENGYNTIYQYNIKSFVSSEYIYREKLFLKNAIGGVGNVTDNNKFKNLVSVAVNDNIVVAQDIGNKCFKVFDKDLNWLNTSIFEEIFNSVTKFDGLILDQNNNLYCGAGKKIYKFTYLPDINVYEYQSNYDLGDYFGATETIKALHNIPSNRDIFYVQTNLSIKKLWFTTLTYVIGDFYFSNNNDIDIKWSAVSKFDDEKDVLILYTNKNNKESLTVNLDKTYVNSLFNIEQFSIFELNELLIHKDEYVQSYVILSKLSKLYYNIFLLLQNIKYKYKEKTLNKYPIIEEKIYNKGFLGYIDSINYEKNFDLGVNEIFQSDVLNRVLQEIYNFQLTVLLYIVNNESDTVYLSPDPTSATPTTKRYVYFVDDSILLSPNPITLNIFEELDPGPGMLTSLGGAPILSDESISIVEGIAI